MGVGSRTEGRQQADIDHDFAAYCQLQPEADPPLAELLTTAHFSEHFAAFRSHVLMVDSAKSSSTASFLSISP